MISNEIIKLSQEVILLEACLLGKIPNTFKKTESERKSKISTKFFLKINNNNN